MDLTHIYLLNEIGGKANQEDSIWPGPENVSLHDKAFIVCDGVGGHDKGEIASRIISEYVGSAIRKLEKREMSDAVVNGLLREATKSLINHAQQNGLNTDMATTFTLLVLADSKVFISWCGDSRIYHIRKGEILYKTADHSLVNSLIKTGEITEKEALHHPRKNVILRAVKADGTTPEADHHLINDVMDGDYFMLCTDGLLENITDKDLTFLLTQNDNGSIDLIKGFQQFCQGKTKDNYSMYLIKVKLNKKSSGYKKKIATLAIFLAMLITASVFILGRYFSKKQHIQPLDEKTVFVPPQNDTPALSHKDTVELLKKGTAIDSIHDHPAKQIPTLIPIQESRKEKEKNIRGKNAAKMPLIIYEDNTDDTDKTKDVKEKNNQKNALELKNKTSTGIIKDSTEQ
ncbi:MAG: protein phosphatase 2C domain-containing protein [Ferruginibacter sp.]